MPIIDMGLQGSSLRISTSDNEHIGIKFLETIQISFGQFKQSCILWVDIQVLYPGAQDPDFP